MVPSSCFPLKTLAAKKKKKKRKIKHTERLKVKKYIVGRFSGVHHFLLTKETDILPLFVEAHIKNKFPQ